jgi:hypothetical protein
MIRGRCLCGEVAFEIAGEIIELGNCHCSECRRAYGAAFGTVAVVAREHFAYVSGESRVRVYRQSERVNRHFCDSCGSPLPMVEEWDPLVGVPAGLLDEPLDARISSHIFVGSKACWSEIHDTLPKHQAWPPYADMNDRAANLKRED